MSTTSPESTLLDRAVKAAAEAIDDTAVIELAGAVELATAAAEAILALPELRPLAGGPNTAKALNHPVRVRILELIGAHARLSPVGFLTWEQGWTLGTVSYHFRYLAQRGLIEEVATRQRRGAVEHIYAMTRDAA